MVDWSSILVGALVTSVVGVIPALILQYSMISRIVHMMDAALIILQKLDILHSMELKK